MHLTAKLKIGPKLDNGFLEFGIAEIWLESDVMLAPLQFFIPKAYLV
jgi:hypothetical protein